VILLACGGRGRLSVSEYADEIEQLIATLASRFDALEAEWSTQEPTIEGAQSYWESRLAVRADLLDAVRALNPPDELIDLNETALGLFTRVSDAEIALAARVATYDDAAELEGMWDTPEGQVALAALEDVYILCRATQAEFDATKDREAFGSVPWIPPEMKEIIQVAFGCPP
jgi:hypothetical protein